ncbi:hypothetical protein FHS31_001733 [Sphingomonas vulcanisoli]|uniref:DUF2116 family Zn-ribbon domain-containing protein n=1 Tax=Sphingomonas vulcanisoli TaxID=1658060 RepID=A0ABX0TRG6_9SPHN|nr:hypothetical protein [Sphingomonas vulcanisoli]NIJ08123.1 hypothetical protein [Sphingomonas vulcanisoli]
MILRSPCPKCREPMIPGVLQCLRCKYKLTAWEGRHALWMLGLKLLIAALAITALIYVIYSN